MVTELGKNGYIGFIDLAFAVTICF